MKVIDDIRKTLRRRPGNATASQTVVRELEGEKRYFDANRARWAAEGHLGEYVLVHNDRPQFFPSLRTAFDAGMEQVGEKGFFIREVTKEPERYELLSAWADIGKS